MTKRLTITPVGPVHGAIRPPGSKSITNRALICAALARGNSRLSGVLDSDDTRVMMQSLRTLGIDVKAELDGTQLDISGCEGHIPSRQAELFVANSGTTMRFLTAILCAGHGTYRLDGSARMRERPIGDLVEALARLGAEIQAVSPGNCPPVAIDGRGLAGGTARVRGDISSQFLSGLLMAAPYARRAVELVVDGPLVSQPYVHMTLGVMDAFGVPVKQERLQRFAINAPRTYSATNYHIEPDASAASYFWAVAAITGGTVTVQGLGPRALQGDIAFCNCLEKMGCTVQWNADRITVVGKPLRGIRVDMNPISDTVQTLAAVALFASGPTTITGVAHIRHKETDRIGDLARELTKLGATVEQHDDGLTITPGPLRSAEIETYDDHRMAMSLALVGLKAPGVVIRDPQCTEKTYPRFFQDLQTLCAG